MMLISEEQPQKAGTPDPPQHGTEWKILNGIRQGNARQSLGYHSILSTRYQVGVDQEIHPSSKRSPWIDISATAAYCNQSEVSWKEGKGKRNAKSNWLNVPLPNVALNTQNLVSPRQLCGINRTDWTPVGRRWQCHYVCPDQDGGSIQRIMTDYSVLDIGGQTIHSNLVVPTWPSGPSYQFFVIPTGRT